MDLSIFLARVLGLYFVIVAFAYLFRREFFHGILEDFYENRALIGISAVINLIIGLLIVVPHNIWEFNWRLIITLVGYLSLLKGFLHLFVPEYGKKLAEKFRGDSALIYTGVIVLVLGVYLLYHGFWVR